jgi:hypothetical protein
MTTLPIRAPFVPQIRIPGFARFVAVVSAVVDAYTEALDQVHEARKRYPYASE